jgi:hypothetical protein
VQGRSLLQWLKIENIKNWWIYSIKLVFEIVQNLQTIKIRKKYVTILVINSLSFIVFSDGYFLLYIFICILKIDCITFGIRNKAWKLFHASLHLITFLFSGILQVVYFLPWLTSLYEPLSWFLFDLLELLSIDYTFFFLPLSCLYYLINFPFIVSMFVSWS